MRRSRGLTLIECIIATFILAVGFLAVASVYPLAYRGAVLDATHVAALQVASATLAEVRTLPYGTPVPASMTDPLPVDGISEGVRTTTVFTREVHFARGGTGANPGALSDVASVTVRWDEGTWAGGGAVHKFLTISGGVCRVP